MKVCRLYACMYIHMYSNVQGYCTSRIRRRNHCASKVYSHAEHALHSASSVTQLPPSCNDTDTKQYLYLLPFMSSSNTLFVVTSAVHISVLRTIAVSHYPDLWPLWVTAGINVSIRYSFMIVFVFLNNP